MRTYTRVAGFAYLAIIIVSILNLVLVESQKSLLRTGLAIHLLMFAGVVVLAWALYSILKTVDRNLALLALLLRMVEATVGAVTVLIGMLAIALADDRFLDARNSGLDVVVLFLSLGTIIFSYLLWKSRYVPRLLSGLGMAAFTLMLLSSVLNIFTPDYTNLTVAVYAPGTIFELSIGIWLLFKGINKTSDEHDPSHGAASFSGDMSKSRVG